MYGLSLVTGVYSAALGILRYLSCPILLVVIGLYSGVLYANVESPRQAEQHNILYHEGGWNNRLREYQFEALEMLLEYSEERYGPYVLNYKSRGLSSARMFEQVNSGDSVNLTLTPNSNPQGDLDNLSYIRAGFFKGLLGLRTLIRRRSDEERFEEIGDAAAFRKLSAGQGRGWAEVKIYEDANIRVVESLSTDILFPMLVSKRSDYIPLSILESESALSALPDFRNALEIHRGMYVFYALTSYLVANNKVPEMVERIQYGVNELYRHGAVNSLFTKHFPEYEDPFGRGAVKVFVLNNPELSLADNKQAWQNVYDIFFAHNPEAKIYYIDSSWNASE